MKFETKTDLTWSAQSLKDLLRQNLLNKEVIVVANRTPFSYHITPQGVEVKKPISGLVTALEPVVEACSGVWIGHATGDADRAMTNRHGRIPAPFLKNPYS